MKKEGFCGNLCTITVSKLKAKYAINTKNTTENPRKSHDLQERY